MFRFRLESHGGIVGTTSVLILIVRSRRVPSKSNQNWSEGSICPISYALSHHRIPRGAEKSPYTLTSERGSGKRTEGEQGVALTIVTLELHLIGDPVIDLLIVFLPSSQSNLPFNSSSSSSSGRSELFGSILGRARCAEEEISSSKRSSSYSEENVGGRGLSRR